MNFSFNYFGLVLLFSVGFSICGDPHDISSYDPKEFDVNDLLNDPMVIDALQSSESDHEEEPSLREPLNKAKKRNRYTKDIKKLICLGISYRGNKEIPKIFSRLQPANVNPNNLTLGELEILLSEQESRHPWRELEEYPLNEYRNYWAHVCDYFWVKENPEDPRKRACYIKFSLFSDGTPASIFYKQYQLLLTKAEVLRCTCHYYLNERMKRDSASDVFAVLKYSDTKYFNLTRVSKVARKRYIISNFWTNVMLPIPFN